MKKVISSLLIMAIVMLALASNVFAYSATVTLEPSSKEVQAGTEFTVLVSLENIDAGQGLNKVNAKLVYDTKLINKISETNIEALNGWKIKFDAFDGKIEATNKNAVKKSGAILQLSFKSKELEKEKPAGNILVPAEPVNGGNKDQKDTKQATIQLKEITASNGIDNIKVNDVSTVVTLGNSTIGRQPKPNPVPAPTPAPMPAPAPAPAPEPAKIPHAGIEDAPIFLLAALATVAIISLVSLDRLKRKK